MKIRTWLMVSYLVIMLLPIVFAYFFYQWFQSFYEDQAFHDYLDAEIEIARLDQHLQKTALYIHTEEYLDELDELVSNRIGITLFNARGDVLYSQSSETWSYASVRKQELYQDLYRLKTGVRSYTIKKPVFLEEKIIGFYELSLMRVENMKKLEGKRNLLVALLIVTFLIVYTVMILLVNRKLIKPMKKLMTQMDLLGSGVQVEKNQIARNDEIGELISHFERMRELLAESQRRIKQTQKEKEYMIASISHDLKTPLTSISAYSESVLHNQLTEQEKKDYLEIIVDKVDFMKRMFDDLTTYTLLQNSERPVEKVVVESEELFEMLFSGYEEVCSQKGILLTTDIQTTGTIEVNINQLTRVVDNLFSNAVKHTERSKKIWLGSVSMEVNLPEWLFTPFRDAIGNARKGTMIIVQNEGKSIAPLEQEKILEPLYQVETYRTKKDNGTGLGLSIVKMILEKHRGSISIFSKEGYGTTIICQIPNHSKGDEENETA
jgi:signal transduction histidine kinase